MRDIPLVVLCATLRRFPPFERGIPSNDALHSVTNGIDADLFERARPNGSTRRATASPTSSPSSFGGLNMRGEILARLPSG